MNGFLHDLRFALRQLRGSPAFTAVAVLTLALGIGANTAIFSVVDGVLIRSLPFQEPDRLVSLVETGNYKGTLLELRERARTIEEVAGYAGDHRLNLTGDGDPVRLESASVTANFFPLLGVDPHLGRTFLPDEEWSGTEPVVVLSHALWQERYGADPEVLGTRLRLDGVEHTVVGVMPPGFRFPSGRPELWRPLGIDPSDAVDLWARGVGMIAARLGAGVTLDEARAEVATLAPRLRELFPWQMPEDFGRGATVVPIQDSLVGDVRPTLLLLLGAVGLVLLIACANVANLLLARATTRRREMAVRSALGAGRARMLRLVLAESLLLAGLAGALGLLMAVWGMDLLAAGLPPDTPRLDEIALDGRVLAVTAGLALGSVFLFGLIPAVDASRTDPGAVLKLGAGAGRSPSQRRFSDALVAGQVALAVVLVIGAGLLLRSFGELLQVDPGFQADGLVAATVAPPEHRFATAAARRAFYDEVLERVGGLPGVQRAAATTALPFGATSHGSVFVIEGRPDPAVEGGDWPWADLRGVVSHGYLQTMGIGLVEGRNFTSSDRSDSPPVAVISRSLAREYWPEGRPLDQRIRFPGQDWITIVGVVDDVRATELAQGGEGALYLPLSQWDGTVVSLVVRTDMGASALAPGLRAAVRSIDADTPVEGIRGMPELISDSLARPRFTLLFLAAFGGVALLLGGVGIHGLLVYAVNERTREIGVRLALGASPTEVLALVVRRGAVLAGAGICAGLLGAWAGSRVLSGLLYGVSATDLRTFTLVPIGFFAVALLASWLPARRAARVDPMVALRAE